MLLQPTPPAKDTTFSKRSLGFMSKPSIASITGRGSASSTALPKDRDRLDSSTSYRPSNGSVSSKTLDQPYGSSLYSSSTLNVPTTDLDRATSDSHNNYYSNYSNLHLSGSTTTLHHNTNGASSRKLNKKPSAMSLGLKSV